MPLFDFLCKDCEATSEVLVRSAKEKVACPQCGSKNVERLLSTFAVRSQESSARDCRRLCGTDSPCEDSPCQGGGCMLDD